MDTVKCKGCGRDVWAGSKIIDGYCHDCAVRGKNLPEDNEPWAQGLPQRKKPGPAPAKPSTRRKSPLLKLRHRWLWIPIALAVSALIFNGAFWLKSVIVSVSGDAAVIKVLREESNRTFYNRGTELTGEAIHTRARAINAFIDSGASYRMNGEFVFAYKDYRGTLADNFSTAAQANVEMSYNSETGVYKFIISNTGEENDDKLKGYLVTDGAYYIVSENGKTYVLSDHYGERAAVDIAVDASVYDVLMSYRMAETIDTGWLDKQAYAYKLWGGTYYHRLITPELASSSLVFPDARIELLCWQDRPVSCVCRNKESDSDIEYSFALDFFYDSIPQDTPTVADYLM